MDVIVDIRVPTRPRSYPARCGDTARDRHARARSASVALVVLGCMLAFVSFIAVWMRSLVLDTNAYVRAVGPLIDKPVAA